MGQNRGVLGCIGAALVAPWHWLQGALDRTPEGARGAHEDPAGYAETKGRLKAELRESNFKPPSVDTQRQRAAARMCEIIERRGIATVQRELMKVGNR
jgi:hypothetical protein